MALISHCIYIFERFDLRTTLETKAGRLNAALSHGVSVLLLLKSLMIRLLGMCSFATGSGHIRQLAVIWCTRLERSLEAMQYGL